MQGWATKGSKDSISRLLSILKSKCALIWLVLLGKKLLETAQTFTPTFRQIQKKRIRYRSIVNWSAFRKAAKSCAVLAYGSIYPR